MARMFAAKKAYAVNADGSLRRGCRKLMHTKNGRKVFRGYRCAKPGQSKADLAARPAHRRRVDALVRVPMRSAYDTRTGRLRPGCVRVARMGEEVHFKCAPGTGMAGAKKRKAKKSKRGKKCVTFGDGRRVCFKKK